MHNTEQFANGTAPQAADAVPEATRKLNLPGSVPAQTVQPLIEMQDIHKS